MNKGNIWSGVIGLVLGVLLINFLTPVTWRRMMGGYGNYQGGMMPTATNSGPQCGPTGCSLGNNIPGGTSGSGMMSVGMMGRGMMGGSSAMGNGATLMNATDIDQAF